MHLFSIYKMKAKLRHQLCKQSLRPQLRSHSPQKQVKIFTDDGIVE